MVPEMKCNEISKLDIQFKDSTISWESFRQVSCKLVVNKYYGKFIRQDIARFIILTSLEHRRFLI